ncbi:sugar phosphate isomerase/epimerase [Myxococcota bacterium]|nr:sugar phosphate isomerase/epimerase [Myxococcota bacterium]
MKQRPPRSDSGDRTTRRGFLAASAACLASALLPDWASGAVAGEASVAASGAPIALGIQSFTLRRYAFEPMLDVLVSLGVRRVELIPELGVFFYRFGSHFPVTDDDAEIAQMRHAIASRGLSIAGSGVHSIPDEAEAERLFDFAARAGIPLLTISPDDEALDAIDRLCRAHRAIRVGIHNHGPFTRYDTIADVEASLVGREPNFGACVDTGHFIRSGEDPVRALQRLGSRVHGVHLKDHLDAGFFASGCLLGEGKLDLPACFRALREIGFGPDKALSLELERDGDELLADVRACLRTAALAAEGA